MAQQSSGSAELSRSIADLVVTSGEYHKDTGTYVVKRQFQGVALTVGVRCSVIGDVPIALSIGGSPLDASGMSPGYVFTEMAPEYAFSERLIPEGLDGRLSLLSISLSGPPRASGPQTAYLKAADLSPSLREQVQTLYDSLKPAVLSALRSPSSPSLPSPSADTY